MPHQGNMSQDEENPNQDKIMAQEDMNRKREIMNHGTDHKVAIIMVLEIHMGQNRHRYHCCTDYRHQFIQINH